MSFEYYKHNLKFKFEAGTSRGVLKARDIWIVKVSSGSLYGLGECSPLPGLSIESQHEVEGELNRLKAMTLNLNHSSIESILQYASSLTEVSSVRFAIETALLDLQNGGQRRIFENPFSKGEASIPINGLVWMGEKAFMKSQINTKIEDGFNCIKIKIGAIDFEEELSLLHYIRGQFAERDLTIRVDANGAFVIDEAYEKLKALAEYNIHSIEQPIAAGQYEAMAGLCVDTPIPIALDEELIGVNDVATKVDLLEKIKPQFLIFKPSLIGGISATMNWITLAEERKIGWWMTSALESNIGLNAIAQLTAQYDNQIPQGLGTGQLYHNNIDSPLVISKGLLQIDNLNSWNYRELGGFC